VRLSRGQLRLRARHTSLAQVLRFVGESGGNSPPDRVSCVCNLNCSFYLLWPGASRADPAVPAKPNRSRTRPTGRLRCHLNFAVDRRRALAIVFRKIHEQDLRR
jgi:hypothetical protein